MLNLDVSGGGDDGGFFIVIKEKSEMVYVVSREELSFISERVREVDSRERFKILKNFLTFELSYVEGIV